MAFNPTGYLHLGDNWIRVYDSFLIPYRHRLQTDDSITESLCSSHPLSYPYTWYIFGLQAAIVNANDILWYEIGLQSQSQSQSQSQPSPPSPSVPISTNQQHQQTDPYDYNTVDEVYIFDQVINESFEEAATHHVSCSGLTKKIISKNLQVTKYCEKQEEEEEEGEICVVCQSEFERSERVAMLHCKHGYHPRCITPWLLRQNVCPICKAQALSV